MTIPISQSFADLFFEVTGLKIEETKRNQNGWVFIPPSVDLGGKDPTKRNLLTKFGWRHHMENEKCAGWWVNPWY